MEAENVKLKEEISKLREELDKANKSLNFLSKEQKKVSRISRASIASWSQEGIIDALRLRFALGKFGYEYLRSTGYPSPSYVTLNRRMQNFQMDFGILESFLSYLKVKIELLNVNDRWCSIIIDEMEISKNLVFDTSKNCFVGGVSLGPDTAPGNHYTVVLLRGLKNKWKQIIAHEITGPSTPGSDMKYLVDKCIETCKELGLTVKAVVSDMGSNNRAMWKELNVNVSRNSRSTAYSTEDGDIHVIADVPHLLKNLRSATLSRPLEIPAEICESQGLPTKIVSSGYIKNLWIKEINDDTSLRSLHHLNKDHLFPSHFSTMNVATAVQFFSVTTAAALEKAVQFKKIDKNALTTAWWIRLVQEWFEMMTARHVKKGITEKNRHVKLQFLNDFIKITQSMKFGEGWKPLQTGIILSTLSVINLVNDTLSSGFKYFLPGRLSQDALENVFSQVRKKAGSKPTALKARQALKLVCVSQFIADIKDVNYFSDGDKHLFSMPKLQDLPKEVTNVVPVSIQSSQNKPLTCSDENEVHYISGVTLNGILSRKLCSACSYAAENATDPNEEELPEYLQFLTKYSDMGGLHYPSSGFYRICRETEREV